MTLFVVIGEPPGLVFPICGVLYWEDVSGMMPDPSYDMATAGTGTDLRSPV